MAIEFKPGPTMETIPGGKDDTSPKRRGRPPKDPNAPKRTYTPRAGKSLETQLGASLVMANLPLLMLDPTDALDEAEIKALAKAIDAQCKTSPRFRKYVMAALEVTSGGQLVTTVGIIGLRRLARHGILIPNVEPCEGQSCGNPRSRGPGTGSGR